MQDRRKQMRTSGFTLIELLTVVAIIAMLVAIFAVGSRKIRIISFGLQQKSVFHAMTVGLELFSGDFDGYPNSRLTQNSGGSFITGAQHLTEALLGRDERGFERLTRWTPPDDINPPSNDLYTNADASLARRRGPYCEIKYGKVLTIHDLWGPQAGIYDSGATPLGVARSPVITDVFAQNDAFAGGRVGMPILYFKADATKQRFRVDAARQTVDNPDLSQYSDWVYNFSDNLPILNLPWLRDPGAAWGGHFPDPDNAGRNPAQMFYEKITQQANPDQGFYRPYNGATFILMSAGWDGIFGTKDDIVNFD